MLVIGLTGGIGSGKSAACQFFSALGITIIDADQLARDVVKRNCSALAAIKEHFGENMVDSNGHLRRDELRNRIFNDSEARKWLENLLHPLIIEKIKEALKESDSPYTIVEIPLLNKVFDRSFLDRVLVIDSSEEMQIQRAAQRKHLSQGEIKKIMSTQLPREELLKLADDVIINDQDKETLKEKVNKQHQLYLEIVRKQ